MRTFAEMLKTDLFAVLFLFFDPDIPAAYYVRVLEIPTPRWSTYDAVALGVDTPDDIVPPTIQERAWSSPIWYTPANK